MSQRFILQASIFSGNSDSALYIPLLEPGFLLCCLASSRQISRVLHFLRCSHFTYATYPYCVSAFCIVSR